MKALPLKADFYYDCYKFSDRSSRWFISFFQKIQTNPTSYSQGTDIFTKVNKWSWLLKTTKNIFTLQIAFTSEISRLASGTQVAEAALVGHCTGARGCSWGLGPVCLCGSWCLPCRSVTTAALSLPHALLWHLRLSPCVTVLRGESILQVGNKIVNDRLLLSLSIGFYKPFLFLRE